MNKPWFASKTLWVNLIAGAAILGQHFTGFVIEPETQAALLVVLNLILRIITKSAVTW